jgi:hypothetical protein
MNDSRFFRIFLFVVVFIVGYVIATYNYLVRLRNHIRDAWSNIDTELKRRYALIPNLVAAIKGYATHEKEVLERVVTLRNACMADHGSVEHQEGTEKRLVSAMQRGAFITATCVTMRTGVNRSPATSWRTCLISSRGPFSMWTPLCG